MNTEKRSGKLVQQTLSRCTHLEHSESREHSQNSRKKQTEEDIGDVNVTVSNGDRQNSPRISDFPEHSQNSLSSGEHVCDKGKANVS